jgi:exodeoxyribonuclease III
MSGKQKRIHPMFETSENTENSESSQKTSKRQKTNEFKIWSWNVAGLRACVKKNGAQVISDCGADIVFLQETKCNEFPPEIARLSEFPYKKLVDSKVKKGYAGVGMLSRERPLKFKIGFGDERFDNQGRFVHAEFEEFHVINTYVLNSGAGLVNLPTRKQWEEAVLKKLTELDKEKPVIYSGDLNVAHNEIDLRHPEPNRNKTAGFTDQEREDFTRLLNAGFVDVYRTMNPDKVAYTYFSYMHNARQNNVGWRLDYFVVSERIFDQVQDCTIHREIEGSDHVPISLTIRT